MLVDDEPLLLELLDSELELLDNVIELDETGSEKSSKLLLCSFCSSNTLGNVSRIFEYDICFH